MLFLRQSFHTPTRARSEVYVPRVSDKKIKANFISLQIVLIIGFGEIHTNEFVVKKIVRAV